MSRWECRGKSRLKSFSPLGVTMPFVFILKIKINDSMIPWGGSTLAIKNPCQKQAIIYLYVDKKKKCFPKL